MRSFLAKAVLCGIFGCRAVWGQNPASVDPGAVDQHSTDTNEYYQLQDRINRKAERPSPDVVTNQLAPRTRSVPQSGTAQRFLLKKVQTGPSAVLSADEIASIVKPYEGKEVTLNDLNAVVSSLNRVYKSRGFITATAVLPPQNVVDGVVHIQLVEARVGQVIVRNAIHTRRSYFTSRIPVHSGDLLQLQDVEQALNAFNRTNDTRVHALLQPGQQFGTTDLVLEVPPTRWADTSFSADDGGLISTGRNRLGTTETIGSLFGYQDPLDAGVYWSGGMWAGTASYNFPIRAGGLRLGPTFSYDQIEIHQSALQKLAVNGQFYDVGLRLSRPLIRGERIGITGYLTPDFQESTLRSATYQISDIPVRDVVAGIEAQEADKHGFSAADLNISAGDYTLLGLHALLKFGGAVTRVQTLPLSMTGIIRLQGQIKAADPVELPPSQQFQVGGIATVRGYPEGTLISGDGYAASAELNTPLPVRKVKLFGVSLQDRFKTAWFVDQGAVLSGTQRTYLTGAGGGLIVKFSRYLDGRVYLATPLEHRSDYKPLAVHFAVAVQPPFRKFGALLAGHHE